MGRLVMAIYIPARIFLLIFILGAMIKGEWWLSFDAYLLRTALWWVALPGRRSSTTGLTLGQYVGKEMRRTGRENGFADMALTLAKLPAYVAIPCRIMLFLPAQMIGDRTAKTLITYGKHSKWQLEHLMVIGDDDERESAARALAELKPDGYEASLRPLLADRSDAVRAVAEEVLAIANSDHTSDPLLRLIRLTKGTSVPPDLVTSLRNTFLMSSAGERRVVIRKLAEHRGPEALDWLVELIESGGAEATYAISKVEGIEHPRVADALLTQTRGIRAVSALQQLAKRGDLRIEPILMERLEPVGDNWTNGMYCALLAQLPSASARNTLEKRSQKGSGWQRLGAAEALASHAGDLEPLRHLARSRNPFVRFLARDSLRTITKG